VALWKVHPGLRARARLLDADADHVSTAVTKTCCRFFDLARHFAVDHVVAELIQRHGTDEAIVSDDLAITEATFLLREIDEIKLLVKRVMSFKRFAEAAIEFPRSSNEREFE